jgi:selenocysteine-specific elongation factor
VRTMQVIGTAGHVDHGKSALVERLTGIDPDRFAEEKRRGLTIDLGFAWLQLPSGREVGLIDVPGHERFIKNMLAGAGGISVCLFVVAANEGWMPQSAEHLTILDVLRIRHGVAAVTKSDTVDEETLDIATEEVAEHLAPSTLSDVPVVACSVATGAGLERLVAALDTCVQAAPAAPDWGRPRLWVDRVFTIAGAGTVVTGTLAGGSLAVGDEVELSPDGRRARVRAIQSHRRDVARIGPGNRVALNLAGLGRHQALRGNAVVLPEQWRPTVRIDARLEVVHRAILGTDHELTEKGAHLMHAGSAETPVRIKLLDAARLRPGEQGFAQIYLRRPLTLGRGDRFVLRDAGRALTFGGGQVLDPLPGPARRLDVARASLLAALEDNTGVGALGALVAAEGSIDARTAMFRAGSAEMPPGVTRLGESLVGDERLEALARAAVHALEDHHARHPLERGMAREAVRARTGLEPPAFAHLVELLEDVVEDGALLRLRAHSVSLAPDQQRERDRLLSELDAADFTPPPASSLAVDQALVRALIETGDLVRIGSDFYLSARRASEARTLVRRRIAEDGPLTVAQIRDLLGTSRKYAVPLCEWLDGTGATRRRGDVRMLGPNP